MGDRQWQVGPAGVAADPLLGVDLVLQLDFDPMDLFKKVFGLD